MKHFRLFAIASLAIGSFPTSACAQTSASTQGVTSPAPASAATSAAVQAKPLSPDAIILGMRMQTDISFDANTTSLAQRVLEAARAMKPAMANVHAAQDFDPQACILMVNTPIADRWFNKGLVMAESLDSAIRQYGAVSVTRLMPVDSGGIFLIKFGMPMKTPIIAAELRKHPGVISADPDRRVGEADDIQLERADHGWNVRFILGSGDCPSGCIDKQSETLFVRD